MARAISVVTVLVALCCASQAFPPKSEKWDDLIKELEERLKDIKPTAFANQPFLLPGLKDIKDAWESKMNEVKNEMQNKMNEVKDEVQDKMNEVKKEVNKELDKVKKEMDKTKEKAEEIKKDVEKHVKKDLDEIKNKMKELV